MNSTDYLIIALMAVSCIAGLMRGLLRELISLITWFLAVLLAWRFADVLEPHLGGSLADSALRPWAARTVIFVVVLLVGTTVGALINHFVRLSIFSGIDRLLGLVFGGLRAGIGLGLLAIACQAVQIDAEPWYRHSMLMPHAARIGTMLRTLGGESVERFEDSLGRPVRAPRPRRES